MIAVGAVIALPMSAAARQGAAPAKPASAAPPAAPAANPGFYSDDLVGVTLGDPSVPLRHGSIVPKSERVALGGMILLSGIDYTIDYDGGVVYLMRPTHSGDVVDVSYRYLKNAAPTAAASFANGFNAFQLNLLPGAINVRMGFGMTERSADGSVTRSNLFGFNTNYRMGQGAFTGLMLFGDRTAVNATSNFESNSGARSNFAGKSKFILESYSTKFGGGTLSANYQDVSKNFTAFSGAAGAGYDQKTIDQIKKEKGLTREGFGLSDLSLGTLKLSSNFSQVKDGDSAIDWRSFGLKQGGFTLGWSSQEVNSKFGRFSDLAEANSKDLQREAGTRRDTENLGYDFKGGSFKGTGLSITDSTGAQLERHDFNLTAKTLTLGYGDSHVQQAFTGFGNLLDPEKATYGADAGVRRQWMNAQYLAGTNTFQFSDSQIKSDLGSYKSNDILTSGKTWKLAYSDRASTANFASFGSINAADTDSNITSIAAMYGAGVKPNAPAERGNFATGAGIDRRNLGFELTPSKTTSFSVDQLHLQGLTDSGVMDNLTGKIGGLAAGYKSLNLGDNFTEVNRMMGFERASLGTLPGLQYRDISLTDTVNPQRSFSFNDVTASALGSDANHTEFTLNDPRLQIAVMQKNVGANFASVGLIPDPMAGALGALVGFGQSDSKITYMPLASLKYSGEYTTTHDAASGVGTLNNTTNIAYTGKTTTFNLLDNNQNSTTPQGLLLNNGEQKMSLQQVVGNWAFHATRDSVDYAGSQDVDATGKPLTDFTSNTVGVAVKLSKSTSLASELVTTSYLNGDHGSMRTDSVSTALSPRAGITLSNSSIDNNGDQKVDETKRNYGFWYDIAKGLRISYGYVRDLNAGNVTGDGTGTSLLTVGTPATTTPDGLAKLGQSTLGDVAIGGGYGANQWQTPDPTTGIQSTRTQSFSNIRLNTVKPYSLGPVKNLAFNVNTDTATDSFQWIRQNEQGGFSGTLGVTNFGFSYHEQLSSEDQRAADRTFSLSSAAGPNRLLSGSFAYKIRSVPGTSNSMIRNFDIALHPNKRLTITNQLQTNPEVANPNVILGSVMQGTQLNRYKADYASSKDFSFGGAWEEAKNSAINSYSCTSSLDFTLFKSTSPLTFSWGWQAVDGNVPQHTLNRWSLKFDQRAGPNQTFNFMIGSLAYGYTNVAGQIPGGLSITLGYTLRM
jgi:hypothetical protein